ncbi:hypothetical protein HYV21_01665 [Candidatus Microgenomates bacterium]|nr:hypothetical protein [Candidatus Microgenomates bacterium]
MCNYSEVSLSVSPNPVAVGQSINFSISGDASTFIGDSWTGGVTGCSGPWNNITCTSTAPAGDYTWTHEWKHCEGSFDNCSPTCSESAPFTVTCTPTPPPSGPTLTAPANGASITTSSVTLDWNSVANWGNECSDPTSNDVYRVYLQSFDCISAPDPSTQVGSVTRDSGVTELPVSGLSDNTCYVWKVRADSGVGFADSGPRTFRVLLNANAWWQTMDGDMLSSGNIRSLIPQQCVDSPSCVEEFSLAGTGGYPGVVAYGGGSATFTPGVVSNKGWLVNSGYYGRRYDYSWFAKLAPPEVFTDPSSVITDSQINGGNLVSGYASGGYVWRYRNGDLTVNGTANLGNRKVILFVNGNLNLNGNVTLTDGEGFFMAINSGNIQVSPSVSHPNQPALEGFFVSDGTFSTGTQAPTPDNRLYIRGSIAAWSGVALQRNLDPNRTTGGNNTTPGELIEFPPDIIFTFPRQLAREGIIWREVAP